MKDSEGNTALNITINEGHFEVFDMLKKMIFESKEKKRKELAQSENQSSQPRDARLTLNRVIYNMDSASPYYVNITRRKQNVPILQHNENIPTIVEEQANIFQLNESNLEQFQKVNHRLSRRSLVNTWKEQLVKTDIDFGEILEEFNNIPASSTKLPCELEVDLADEIALKFSNVGASSTKLPREIATDVANDSFHTAKSNSSTSEKSFIKSPNRMAKDEEDREDQIQLVEDYRHIDRENGLVFYERKIEPCLR